MNSATKIQPRPLPVGISGFKALKILQKSPHVEVLGIGTLGSRDTLP